MIAYLHACDVYRDLTSTLSHVKRIVLAEFICHMSLSLNSRVVGEDSIGGDMRGDDDDDDDDGGRDGGGDGEAEEFAIRKWRLIVLAQYVWQQRLRFSGNRVVEFGAGTCLPGLIAAKVGSEVTLTDDADRLKVLDNMRRVCELNKLQCKLFTNNVLSFDDLFATVAFPLQSNPGSVLITTYHNRSSRNLIEFLMVKWGIKYLKLLDDFLLLPSDKAARLSGNIQLAEIVLIHEHIEETSFSGAR
ncbi:hypothetical protein CRYUN_Cryun15aG0149600 [Craigia yunnanensis]